jgi:hypothetical protein
MPVPTNKQTAVPTFSPTTMPVAKSGPPVRVGSGFQCVAMEIGRSGRVQLGWQGTSSSSRFDIYRDNSKVSEVKNKEKWNDSKRFKGETHYCRSKH